ncbi:unnamed protein product [Diamesa serratosioi]
MVNYFDLLPDEMLLKVFSYINISKSPCGHIVKNDLLNSLAVCQKWNMVLLGAGAIMRRLPCNFDQLLMNSDKIKFLINIERSLQSIVISNFTPETMEDILCIVEHGSNMREIRLVNCNFNNPILLQLIFQSMPLLEKIHLNGVNIENYIEITPISFEHLVKLDIIESNLKVMHYFMGIDTKIKHLSLNLNRKKPCEEIIHVWNFLSTQNKLQEFTSLGNGFVFNDSSMEELEVNSLKLKKLTFRRTMKHEMLKNFGDQSVLNEDNVLSFMETQARSVEQLSLYRKFSIQIYEFIFLNFTNLKTIHIHMGLFPEIDQTFRFKCDPLRGVKEMILFGNLKYEVSKLIFRIFPNVENLALDNSKPVDNSIMLLITKMILYLKTLHVSTGSDCMFQNCRYLELKSLQIHDFKKMTHIGLTTITKCNPYLETFAIKHMNNEFHSIFDIIARNLKKLKNLTLGTGFHPTLKVAKNIRKLCKSLRVLRIANYITKESEFNCEECEQNCVFVAGCEFFVCSCIDAEYKFSSTDCFDISEHIDHSKIKLVIFELRKNIFDSEFAFHNVRDNKDYYDERNGHFHENLTVDTEWGYWNSFDFINDSDDDDEEEEDNDDDNDEEEIEDRGPYHQYYNHPIIPIVLPHQNIPDNIFNLYPNEFDYDDID